MKSDYIIGCGQENNKGQFKHEAFKTNDIGDVRTVSKNIILMTNEIKNGEKKQQFKMPPILNSKKSLNEQNEIIRLFRLKKFNILVSTSVTEEGFDIPSCNLVISFDAPTNSRSFVQIKGRARQANSKYVIITHESKVATFSS